MAEILLTTLNARYAHASFGLRYLRANLGELAGRAEVLEFVVSQRPTDVVEAIVARRPRIVGIGVYIWNVGPATQVVSELKRVRPEIVVVLGGPEVSYETDRQEICRLADYVITGEADLAFAELCGRILSGRRPTNRVITAALPEFGRGEAVSDQLSVVSGEEASAAPSSLRRSVASSLSGEVVSGPLSVVSGEQAPPSTSSLRASVPFCLVLPYDLYTDEDIAHRVIYVEASRGCPFGCEFCLSSLDVPVRNVPLESFLTAMQSLLDRGARQYKFVDRTFNLKADIGRKILEFFRERYQEGLFLHFEMVPDRLPESLRQIIREFPAGALQFEVGIQTFNEEVAARISRRQDNAKVEENLRFLRTQTGVHVHADLIAGLPGEDVRSFAAGFDRLVALGPQEIQVGILKRLRGAPIARHDREWEMVWSDHPPYEILQTKLIDFMMMQRLKRFARYWDLIANSGNFIRTVPLLWARRGEPGPSPFARFMAFSDHLYQRLGRVHAIALDELARQLLAYLSDELGHDRRMIAASLADDYHRAGRADLPEVVRPLLAAEAARAPAIRSRMPKRQARHLRGT